MNKFTSQKDGGVLTVCFNGEMDTMTCIEIEEQIIGLIKEHQGKTVFDLKNVSYIASSFIRLCGASADITGVNNLSILNMHKDIKKIFSKIGLTTKLDIK